MISQRKQLKNLGLAAIEKLNRSNSGLRTFRVPGAAVKIPRNKPTWHQRRAM